jgi:hypothetical protein
MAAVSVAVSSFERARRRQNLGTPAELAADPGQDGGHGARIARVGVVMGMARGSARRRRGPAPRTCLGFLRGVVELVADLAEHGSEQRALKPTRLS